MANVADGARIQPGFHVLLAIPFLIAFSRSTEHPTLKRAAQALIVAFALFVLSRISRTLVVIMMAMAGIYLVRGQARTRVALLAACVLAAVVLALGAAGNYSERLMRTGPASAGSITRLSGDNLAAVTSGRSVIYPVAWAMFQRDPIFGAGFDSYRHPRPASKFSGNVVIERGAMHSAWLQVLSETGLIGIALYVGIFLASFAALVRARDAAQSNGLEHYREAVMVGLLIFMLGGVFDNFGFSYRIFYLFVAFAVVLRYLPASVQAPVAAPVSSDERGPLSAPPILQPALARPRN
jgi:O-antigen ligase